MFANIRFSFSFSCIYILVQPSLYKGGIPYLCDTWHYNNASCKALICCKANHKPQSDPNSFFLHFHPLMLKFVFYHKDKSKLLKVSCRILCKAQNGRLIHIYGFYNRGLSGILLDKRSFLFHNSLFFFLCRKNIGFLFAEYMFLIDLCDIF